MRKILIDTLTYKGKYSRKSVTGFTAFLFALTYEAIFPFFNLPTKEYVFQGLLVLTGAVLGLTVWDKKGNNPIKEEEENISN